jgi:23S rRNA pseudouridine955/2504/2580 synthase
VGDHKYTCDREMPQGLSDGLHLHARALRLPNPGGRAIEIVAELPQHIQQTFDVLGFETSTVEDFFDLRKPRRKR